MQADKLRALLAMRRALLDAGENYRHADAVAYEDECAEFITEHGTALLAIAEASEGLRAALRGIVVVMGPKTPPCCEGCEWEWTEALRIANAALSGAEDANADS